MIFGRLSLDDQAAGIILAHAVSIGDGKYFKKGRELSDEDIRILKTAGHETVLAAKLEETDVDENKAAGIIADALAGDGTHSKAPFTGRANIFASHDGSLVFDAALLNAINHVDEAITIATIAPYEAVSAGQMLATIKIIPFSVPDERLQKVVAMIDGGLQVKAPVQMRIAVLSTRLANTKQSVIEKSEQVLQDRLSVYGNKLHTRRCIEHHEDQVANAVDALLQETDKYDLIMIFGASATTDRRDVVPLGIERAGGVVDHFGMPVDPGNLLLMAHHGNTQIIGLPGCARSPKMNGFDWVLQRILTDIPVTKANIMDMGSGGLLKEIESRPQSRLRDAEEMGKIPQLHMTALLLAAGQSRRMGSINKLLAPVGGKPMVETVMAQLQDSNIEDIIVVTGHESDLVRQCLAVHNPQFIHNPDFDQGLSTSLKTGIRAVPEAADGILVCLGDMPMITSDHIDKLLAAFDPVEGRIIIVPTSNGKRGNPVLIGSQFKDDILKISGDMGAKALIGQNEDIVFEVEIDSSAIFTDIDTPRALSEYNKNSPT